MEAQTTFWFCSYSKINDAVKQRDSYASPESANALTRAMVYALDNLINKNKDYIVIIEWLAEKQLFNLYDLNSFDKHLLGINQLEILLDWCGGSLLTFAARQDKTWGKGKVVLVGCEPNIDDEIRGQIFASEPPSDDRYLRLVFSGNELVETNVSKEINDDKQKMVIDQLIEYKIIQIQTNIREKYFGREIPNEFGGYSGQRFTQEQLVERIKVFLQWQKVMITDGSKGKEVHFLIE